MYIVSRGSQNSGAGSVMCRYHSIGSRISIRDGDTVAKLVDAKRKV